MKETRAFLYNLAVPSNNLEERDGRSTKARLKIVGGFYSAGGADAFCAPRSYLLLLRKQGRSVLPAPKKVIPGKPIYPKLLAESLLSSSI